MKVCTDAVPALRIKRGLQMPAGVFHQCHRKMSILSNRSEFFPYALAIGALSDSSVLCCISGWALHLSRALITFSKALHRQYRTTGLVFTDTTVNGKTQSFGTGHILQFAQHHYIASSLSNTALKTQLKNLSCSSEG